MNLPNKLTMLRIILIPVFLVLVLVESIPSQQSRAAGRPLNTNSFTNKSELLWAISRIRWRFWESFGRIRSFA